MIKKITVLLILFACAACSTENSSANSELWMITNGKLFYYQCTVTPYFDENMEFRYLVTAINLQKINDTIFFVLPANYTGENAVTELEYFDRYDTTPAYYTPYSLYSFMSSDSTGVMKGEFTGTLKSPAYEDLHVHSEFEIKH